jgi:hypothetical protein
MGVQESSSESGRATRRPAQLVTLAALAAGLLALLVVLATDLVSGTGRVICLFGACVIVALTVVVIPNKLRKTAGSFAAAFVAAAGVLPVFLSGDDPASPAQPRPSPQAQVHPAYLAELVRRGPFTEPLPSPLRVSRLRDVRINDPSASARLDAVWVDIDASAEEGVSVFAMIEVYPSPAAAAERKKARIDTFKRIYPGDPVYDNCFDEHGAHGGGWTCIATRGYAYAEAAVSPSANAYMGFATGTLTALLRYTDRLAKVAS